LGHKCTYPPPYVVFFALFIVKCSNDEVSKVSLKTCFEKCPRVRKDEVKPNLKHTQQQIEANGITKSKVDKFD